MRWNLTYVAFEKEIPKHVRISVYMIERALQATGQSSANKNKYKCLENDKNRTVLLCNLI